MEAIKVLVVDDNKRIVTILKEALERETDMEVVGTASDGEEALSKISALRPDVVLLDLIMPKVDGLGVMERMKKGNPIRDTAYWQAYTPRRARSLCARIPESKA